MDYKKIMTHSDTQIATVLPKVITQKEEYYLDAKDIPDEPDLIRYELNLAEFPIFTKNHKIKDHVSMKYIFSEKTDEYIAIIPNSDPEAISRKILQEFDEKIFYGILKIYGKTNNRKIITDYPNLLKQAGILYDNKALMRVKDSLQRMNACQIIFNNAYYDAVAKAQGFEFLKRTKYVTLIRNLEIITFKKFQEMSGKEKENYTQYFNKHHKIQEIALFYLNEEITENIAHKAFKYFDHEDLIKIENGVARKLYVMLTKWRYWEKGNVIRRKTKFLASRIPLSWKKDNIRGTIRSLKNACEDLKLKQKIATFKLNGKGQESSIDFIFDDKGRLHYFNQNTGIETTGQENLEIIEVEAKEIPQIPHNSEILDIIPANQIDRAFIESLGIPGTAPELIRQTIAEIGVEAVTEIHADFLKQLKRSQAGKGKKIDAPDKYYANHLRKRIGVKTPKQRQDEKDRQALIDKRRLEKEQEAMRADQELQATKAERERLEGLIATLSEPERQELRKRAIAANPLFKNSEMMIQNEMLFSVEKLKAELSANPR